MNSQLRQKAVNLRTKSEMSYSEIRKRLNVSKSTLSYWLHDYPLNEKRILELRRAGWQKGEAGRERFRNTMRKKKEEVASAVYDLQRKKLGKLNDKSLFVAGLMIYLGEGDKKNEQRICVANTDSRIIRFFIWWMIKYLDVNKDDLRMQLHLYENMNILTEENYWIEQVDIKRNQLYKTQIRPVKRNTYSYKEPFRHGTCSLFFSRVAKKLELMMALKAFMDIYLCK